MLDAYELDIGFEQLRPAVDFAAVEGEHSATDGLDPAAPVRPAVAMP
jgi:hypothetical protein